MLFWWSLFTTDTRPVTMSGEGRILRLLETISLQFKIASDGRLPRSSSVVAADICGCINTMGTRTVAFLFQLVLCPVCRGKHHG